MVSQASRCLQLRHRRAKANAPDLVAHHWHCVVALSLCACASVLVVCLLQLYSLEQCVLGAYAADGGMFLPATLPALSPELLRDWANLDFSELVFAFMSLFILEEEVSAPELRAIIQRAFAKFTRRATADGEQSVREEIGVHHLQSAPAPARDVTIAELWHGQTLASVKHLE